VVQPKNLAANQRKVSAVDLKGSSNIGQDAHNIVLIHRNMDSKKNNNLVEIEVAKNRELGTCGTISLEFDTNSKANYYECDTED
jgi:replicative DNA helicase